MSPFGPKAKPQRGAVIDLLAHSPRFLSARAICDQLNSSGRPVGLSTVYRALRELAQSGELDWVWSPHDQRLYHLRTGRGPHHLSCRRCGFAMPVDASRLLDLALPTAHEHGFSGVTCVLRLTGLCPTCSGDVPG